MDVYSLFVDVYRLFGLFVDVYRLFEFMTL